MENEIVVKSNVGDVVVAKGEYGSSEDVRINIGEEWTVLDKFGLFVKIQNGDRSFWLGDVNFVEVFEGNE